MELFQQNEQKPLLRFVMLIDFSKFVMTPDAVVFSW